MHLLRSATCLVLVVGTTSGLGDRFAWSPVEVAEDTREGKLVEEVDEVVRNVRKVAEEEENEKENKEQIEGRFVGKEVLCSLGLADVSMRKCNKEQFDERIFLQQIACCSAHQSCQMWGSSMSNPLRFVQQNTVFFYRST